MYAIVFAWKKWMESVVLTGKPDAEKAVETAG
jgi:hypothetical protein